MSQSRFNGLKNFVNYYKTKKGLIQRATAVGAFNGALAGGVLGIAASTAAALPTFGLSYLAIPIWIAMGSAAGAAIGFVASNISVMVSYHNKNKNKKPKPDITNTHAIVAQEIKVDYKPLEACIQCPLSQELPKDAQIISDGHTYDANQLHKYIKMNSKGVLLSPVTNTDLIGYKRSSDKKWGHDRPIIYANNVIRKIVNLLSPYQEQNRLPQEQIEKPRDYKSEIVRNKIVKLQKEMQKLDTESENVLKRENDLKREKEILAEIKELRALQNQPAAGQKPMVNYTVPFNKIQQIQQYFICPISKTRMVAPVVGPDGNTYEQEVAQRILNDEERMERESQESKLPNVLSRKNKPNMDTFPKEERLLRVFIREHIETNKPVIFPNNIALSSLIDHFGQQKWLVEQPHAASLAQGDDEYIPNPDPKRPALNLMAVEDELLCPISFEPVKNPVVTSTGHTYEKELLKEYVDKQKEVQKEYFQRQNELHLSTEDKIKGWIKCPHTGGYLQERPGTRSKNPIVRLFGGSPKSKDTIDQVCVQNKTIQKIVGLLNQEGPDIGSDQKIKAIIEALKCPITKKLMQDPVVGPDGISYERTAAQEKFEKMIAEAGAKGANPLEPDLGPGKFVLVPNIMLKAFTQKLIEEKIIIKNPAVPQVTEAWLEDNDDSWVKDNALSQSGTDPKHLLPPDDDLNSDRVSYQGVNLYRSQNG